MYIGAVHPRGISNIWAGGGVGARYPEYGEFDSE